MKNTKNKIIDAAIDLFADNGYTETSMRSIASRVQVKPASIYNHFESKAEILDTIFEEYLSYMNEHNVHPYEVDKLDIKSALSKMFYTFEPEMHDRMTKILKIVIHEQFREDKAHYFMYNKIYQENYKYIKGILDKLVEIRKLRPFETEIYAKIFVATLVSSTIEIMHFYLDKHEDKDWESNENTLNFLVEQIINTYSYDREN